MHHLWAEIVRAVRLFMILRSKTPQTSIISRMKLRIKKKSNFLNFSNFFWKLENTIYQLIFRKGGYNLGTPPYFWGHQTKDLNFKFSWKLSLLSNSIPLFHLFHFSSKVCERFIISKHFCLNFPEMASECPRRSGNGF